MKECFICKADLRLLKGLRDKELHINDCLDKAVESPVTVKVSSKPEKDESSSAEDLYDENSLPIHCPSCSLTVFDLKITKYSVMQVHMKQCAQKTSADLNSLFKELNGMKQRGDLIKTAEITATLAKEKSKAKSKTKLVYNEFKEFEEDEEFESANVSIRRTLEEKRFSKDNNSELKKAIALSLKTTPQKKKQLDQICSVLPVKDAQTKASEKISDLLTTAVELKPTNNPSKESPQVLTKPIIKRSFWKISSEELKKLEPFDREKIDEITSQFVQDSFSLFLKYNIAIIEQIKLQKTRSKTKENLEPNNEEILFDNYDALNNISDDNDLPQHDNVDAEPEPHFKAFSNYKQVSQKPGKSRGFYNDLEQELSNDALSFGLIENRIFKSIQNSDVFYEKILMYERIEINELKSVLEKSNIEVSKKQLTDFLNSQSISSYDSQRPSMWKHKKKKTRQKRT